MNEFILIKKLSRQNFFKENDQWVESTVKPNPLIISAKAEPIGPEMPQ